MAQPILKLDTREWSATLKEYLAHSSRDLAALVNQGAFNVTTTSSKITKKADKSEVQAVIGPSSKPNYALMIYMMKRKGIPIPKRPDLKEAVEKEWKLHSGAIAFLRAGWLPAIAVMARAIGKSPSRGAERLFAKFGQKIGGGKAAAPGTRPIAEFFHAAFAKYTNEPRVLAMVETALRSAMEQDVARMRARIEAKLQATANKMTARFLR